MKFLTVCRAEILARLLFLLLPALLINLPAMASERLSELKLANYGANGIVLFPDHEVKDFNLVMEAP
ncbi:MAG: hypothetical protein EOM80_16660, partial [Erysipelotrichia bacterium]|nr:hypothetical protein [Erysipelotrichia bacterium]